MPPVRRLFSVDVGLFILFLDLMMFFFPPTNPILSFGGNLVYVLEANPNAYLQHALLIFFFMLLPQFVGLTFCVVGYIREIRTPTGILDTYWLVLAAFGVLSFLWGYYEFVLWTAPTYASDMGFATPQVAAVLPNLYGLVFLWNIIWVVAGVLLITSPILELVLWLRRKRQKQQASN